MAPFGDREVQFVQALLPHLCRSLQLHDLLARAAQDKQAALDGLDVVPLGVLLVTGDGRVVHANRVARQILDQRDGLVLDEGCLIASSPASTSLLRERCADCARTTLGERADAAGALAIRRPSGRRSLQVLVSPVKRHEPLGLRDDRVTAAVLVSDPERHAQPDRSLLQVFYGLTATEADVTARLAAGESLEDIAAARRYTKQTVQWYAKQILNKVGCRNRAALVRQVSMTLSSLTPPGPA